MIIKTHVFVLLALALPDAVIEDTAGLPAEECVRLMRGARIARMHDDAATERTKLEQALEACPEEIAPVYGLMRYHRQQPELEDRYKQFLSQLTKRLLDPEYDLPTGVVEYLIRDPKVEESELLAIMDNLSRQVRVTAAARPDPLRLRILAQLQLRLDQTEAATETFGRLRLLDDSEDLVRPLYALYARLERWQDAARLLEPLIEEDRELRFLYVHILGKLGRYEDVIRQIESFPAAPELPDTRPAIDTATDTHAEDDAAITRQGGFDLLLRQVAWDLRDRGQDAEAEQIFRDLRKNAPDDPGLEAIVLNLYADAEERQGHAAALADSWQAETDPNLLFEEGTQRLTAGDAAGAIDLLRRAAPEFPDLEAVWYNLGMAAYRLEDWATVESAFARAGELNPGRAQAFFFRGIALVKLERCADAVKDLERAAELDPERALSHYYLSVCYQQLGEMAAAAAARQRYQATRD